MNVYKNSFTVIVETHGQFRLLQIDLWPTLWIFLDIPSLKNVCPVLNDSFKFLRNYLTNRVKVYDCEPINLQLFSCLQILELYFLIG